ncbi:MAG TPA: hypothetical protein VF934_01065 [Burkholderiales bacterium]
MNISLTEASPRGMAAIAATVTPLVTYYRLNEHARQRPGLSSGGGQSLAGRKFFCSIIHFA